MLHWIQCAATTDWRQTLKAQAVKLIYCGMFYRTLNKKYPLEYNLFNQADMLSFKFN